MKFDQTDTEYIEAMQHYLSGDWKESKKAFTDLIGRFPDSTFLHLLLGNVYYSMGKLETARETYNKAVELNPEFGIAYYKIGVCAYREGRLRLALENFEKVVALGGQSHAMASYFIGLINLFLGNDDKAIDGFAELRKDSPESLIANYYLAQEKMKKKDFEAAITLLEELLKHTSNFAEVYYLLGNAHYRLHNNTEALKYLRKAQELNRNDKRTETLIGLLTNIDWP